MNISLCVLWLGFSVVNGQHEESIVFPASYNLHRQRSFELLTSNAVTTESVVELSRAAEAFSLEYFQVNITCYYIPHLFIDNNCTYLHFVRNGNHKSA